MNIEMKSIELSRGYISHFPSYILTRDLHSLRLFKFLTSDSTRQNSKYPSKIRSRIFFLPSSLGNLITILTERSTMHIETMRNAARQTHRLDTVFEIRYGQTYLLFKNRKFKAFGIST